MQIKHWQVHPSITEDRIMAAVESRATSLDNPGFCLNCGADAEGVEPDAEDYICEACEAPAVYGAEEVMMHTAF